MRPNKDNMDQTGLNRDDIGDMDYDKDIIEYTGPDRNAVGYINLTEALLK